MTALRNYGVKNWEICAALEISVAQRLARRLCSRCRVLADTTEAEQAWFRDNGAAAPSSLWQPAGCDACGGTGFDGRVGLFEVWRLNAEARTLILHGADEPALRHNAQQSGTRPLLTDAIDKVSSGLTSLSEIRTLWRQGVGASAVA